ncbi:MAG: class I SAM-dependent methyltransferase [Steroidobacteraceae bacterium]
MSTDQFTDLTLETLFRPFSEGLLAWPEGGALFLRARDGAPLHQQALPGLICEQTFKPDADALKRAGLSVNPSTDTAAPHIYPLVLVLPPRQRDEARALLARAVSLTQAGGRVLACISNNEGARSGEADLEKLVGPVSTLSKHKCRVFWSAPLHDQVDTHLLQQWLTLDAVRPIGDARFVSRPGVFAWDRIDPASVLLAQHLPRELNGRAADLGAGFGYLSVELLSRCAGIAALDVYEAESRALELARQNLSNFAAGKSPSIPIRYHWHDVTSGLLGAYDVIVSNPPFHTQSRADRPDIGRRFISAAAEALNPGGCLWLVANRHLPYEEVLNSSFGHTRIVAQQDGFKIVMATKTASAVHRHERSRSRR